MRIHPKAALILQGRRSLELRPRQQTHIDNRDQSFFDFIVGGSSLHELLGAHEMKGFFTTHDSSYSAHFARQLLLLEQHELLAAGRTELYSCPLCGDLGCGSLTVKVSREDDAFVWSDFALEYSYDLNPDFEDDNIHCTDFESYVELGPVYFEASAYRALFEPLARLDPFRPDEPPPPIADMSPQRW